MPQTFPPSHAESREPRRFDRRFAMLFASYTLEGIGYIVAGTFLVAAIKQTSSGWLGDGAWLFVGLAAAPSAALWAWLGARWSHPKLLVVALTLQAVGIALPAVAGGATAALVGAVLFGGTFIGVSTMTLAAGRLLRFPGRGRAADSGLLRGADHRAGGGGASAAPRLPVRTGRGRADRRRRGGRRSAAAHSSAGTGAVRVIGRQPCRLAVDGQVADVGGEGLDHGAHGRIRLTATPDQRPRPQRRRRHHRAANQVLGFRAVLLPWGCSGPAGAAAGRARRTVDRSRRRRRPSASAPRCRRRTARRSGSTTTSVDSSTSNSTTVSFAATGDESEPTSTA